MAVPDFYFSPLEINGQRRDLGERAELWRGSVDFVATNEQVSASPEKPVTLFILDVSSVAVSTGLVAAFINSIKHGSYRLNKHNDTSLSLTLCFFYVFVVLARNFETDESARFGFITFDKTVHFWKISASNLQMVVMPDVSNVFQPLPHDSFIANYATHKEVRDL
jgi:protein transport protein SEC24